MATNPLFQGYRKQEVFNAKTVHNRSFHFQNTPMAQRSRDQHGSKRGDFGESDEGKPQLKRRRVDNPADDAGDWDDSFEFTQQDLENLDVVASQAIGEPSTSKQGTELDHGDAEQTLDLGLTSFNVTEGQDRPGLFQAPAPGATVRLKNRSSTSSSSESSVYPQSSASLR